MKVVATYRKPEDAHLARSVLEGSGVAAYVRDEFTVTANFFYSAIIGGVRLEVADEDQARARDVFKNSAEAGG
jgi:hypothetical protein